MLVTAHIAELRDFLSPRRQPGIRIGLVPTMGALHDGHLALMRACRSTCDIVVASIFVNPTQFGPNEDLSRYPRTLDEDLSRCTSEGVDVVFTPTSDEMYPASAFIGLTIHTLADHLCGAARPGHFNGVLQIVNKLFNIVQPTDAWFGQKDLQQFVLIETMVREFNLPVQLHRGETVRESDGLALSSRNRYLSEGDRVHASVFPDNLRRIVADLQASFGAADPTHPRPAVAPSADPTHPRPAAAPSADPTHPRPAVAPSADPTHPRPAVAPSADPIVGALAAAAIRLEAKGFKIDYLTVSDYKTLQPVTRLVAGEPLVLAGAVYLGKTRLIDNILFQL